MKRQEEENIEFENKKNNQIEKIKEHLSGPSLSIIIHMIIIIFLMGIIVVKAPREEKKIIAPVLIIDKIEIPVKEEMPEPPEEEILETEPEVEEYDISFEERDSETKPCIQPDTQNQIAPSPNDFSFESKFNIKMTNSGLKMPALLISRKSGMKGKGFKQRGGTHKSMQVLYKGLRWLKDHQNPDGSWGDTRQNNFSAYTGLALLAFLGAAETPSSAEFGKTVIKAIRKLVEYVNYDGNGVKGGYRHAIATYALCEGYGMTQIPMLEEPVKKCVQRIINAVNSDGSFNYGYDNSKMRSDLSVAGWNYQALKAGYGTGIEIQGLEDCIDKCISQGLEKSHFCGSGFSYNKNSGKNEVMTAVGALCLQLFGKEKEEVATAVRFLEDSENFWFSWKGHEGKVHPWALYKWYYQTQVIFQAHHGKGGKWKKWNKMFSRELARKQNNDGSWFSPAYEAKLGGHSENTELPGIDQQVYATSLSCLMLEVYFRYLTTFQPVKNKVKEKDDDKDKIKIELASTIRTGKNNSFSQKEQRLSLH